MNRNELEADAQNLIRRLKAGDSSIASDIGVMTARLLLSTGQMRPGSGDFRRVHEDASVDIFRAAPLLKNAPEDALAWMNKKVEAARVRHADRVARDRDLASSLQQRLLPARHLEAHGLDIAFGIRPLDAVGGDFFDYSVTRDDMVILVGDGKGKGTHAGIVATYIHGQFREVSKRIRDPRKLMKRLSDGLHTAWGGGGDFATIIAARWDPRRGILAVCNAGNVLPHLITGGRVGTVGDTGPLAGMFRASLYDATLVRVGSGDILLMSSDGLTEQRTNNGEEFSMRKLAGGLAESSASTAKELLETSWRSFDRATHKRAASDDQMIAVVRVV